MSSSTQRKLLPLFILAAFAAATSALFLYGPKPKERPAVSAAPQALPVVYAQPKSRYAIVTSQGTVRPKWQVDLVAEASGRVISMSDQFVSGGFFRAADELLKVEPLEYEVALARSEARLAQAQQVLSQERGQARLAQREWQELGSSEANDLFLRKPQIAAAEAEVKVALAELDQARVNLQRTRLTAPFSGRLLEANVQVGDRVAIGTAVGKAFSTDVMEVPLPLTSSQLALVDLPLHAGASMDIPVAFAVEVGGTTHTWHGNIVRTEASFDTQSRVVNAVAEVRDAYQKREDGAPPFAPGLFARAEITGRPFDDAIELPRSAIYERTNVLALDDNNRLQVMPVNVLQSASETVLVRGVSPGTAILLERPSLLVRGMAIQPLLQPQATASGNGQTEPVSQL
ncbi:efflux RND transporter periplasmic adaptor subunit [bacterium SCSIO 12696]|nr:efflux RND transporter periplasmic adaptor subunit [bacterium SCSIO 12696]